MMVGAAVRLKIGVVWTRGNNSRTGKVEVTKKRRAARCGKLEAGGQKRARIETGRKDENPRTLKNKARAFWPDAEQNLETDTHRGHSGLNGVEVVAMGGADETLDNRSHNASDKESWRVPSWLWAAKLLNVWKPGTKAKLRRSKYFWYQHGRRLVDGERAKEKSKNGA